MIEQTLLSDHVVATDFINKAMKASTAADIRGLLAELPIVSEEEYNWDEENPTKGWQPGRFHWVPVGRDRGNAGRIKQASTPINPIAERTVNGMEAIIELARARELLLDPGAPAPKTPRDAVARYFQIPSLDQLPKLDKSEASKAIRQRARNLARQLRVRVLFDKASREFTIGIEDDGIGQTPDMIHKTLMSLGTTTKADKFYLIGVFGQGGSSAYSECDYSWLISRRAEDVLGGHRDGAGWTVIKRVYPPDRRDDYFAYLACTPDGRVPFVTAADADTAKINNGTRFVHIAYDFGRGGSSISRQLYRSLNHVLYNPVLPFDLSVSGTDATVYGNGYRLSSLTTEKSRPPLDKLFPQQPVTI
jgi:hypothetical protein